jgi:septal ring factor EnvC (AmiA/AmiB activator)
MTICPKCLAGDQRLRPGSVASGVFCGCGNRLIPEPPTPVQAVATDTALLKQAATQIQQSQTANTNLATVLRGTRMENDRLKANLESVTKERDELKAEIASIQAALSVAGLPHPLAGTAQVAIQPIAQQLASAQQLTDFHGVPLVNTAMLPTGESGN